MYSLKNIVCLVLLNVLFSVTVSAAEPEAEEKSPWTSSVELGYVSTSGNTETQTTKLKADVSYEIEKWRHTAHADAYGQEAQNADTGNNEVSAERYEISGKSDYKFSDHDYAFGLIKLQKDRFSGFQYEYIASLGYGNKVVQKKNMELDLEIGPGARFYKEDKSVALPTPENIDEAVLVLAADYWWDITESSKFTQIFNVDIGEAFTSSKSVTGIQANINSTLALKFTYTIRNKSKVPDGTEKTDTETAMLLVYSF